MTITRMLGYFLIKLSIQLSTSSLSSDFTSSNPSTNKIALPDSKLCVIQLSGCEQSLSDITNSIASLIFTFLVSHFRNSTKNGMEFFNSGIISPLLDAELIAIHCSSVDLPEPASPSIHKRFDFENIPSIAMLPFLLSPFLSSNAT